MHRRRFNSLPLLFAQGGARRRARDLYLESTEERNAPLGLRYTLFREHEGEWLESAFDGLRTGERIRLLVEANCHGKLHVFTRDAKGEWEVAAPDLPVQIDPEHAFTLPPTGRWVLDPPAGVETLCLVLWRDSDKALDEIDKNGEFIREARAKSRDLVLETVSGPNKNTSYAVNPAVAEDAKVVVEISIRHAAG